MTLNGNGDIPEASVIGGTTARPFSDEVYVIMVCIVFINVVDKFEWNVWRSAKVLDDCNQWWKDGPLIT